VPSYLNSFGTLAWFIWRGKRSYLALFMVKIIREKIGNGNTLYFPILIL
jgi:hypothetical protein